jgi:acetyltransferase-like isoleucine patch superfamily enzyme
VKKIDLFYWVREYRNKIDTAICRRKCESVGENTRFGSNIVIIGGKQAVGRGIRIGSRCSFNDFCQIVTDHYNFGCGIEIGDNCHFNFGCYISGTGGLKIGNDCLFAPGVKILTSGHNFDDLELPIVKQGLDMAEVVIEDNVWVGAGAIVLQNVTIGSGSVIAAGAVVNRSVKPNSVVGGVPASLIRKRGIIVGRVSR